MVEATNDHTFATKATRKKASPGIDRPCGIYGKCRRSKPPCLRSPIEMGVSVFGSRFFAFGTGVRGEVIRDLSNSTKRIRSKRRRQQSTRRQLRLPIALARIERQLR